MGGYIKARQEPNRITIMLGAFSAFSTTENQIKSLLRWSRLILISHYYLWQVVACTWYVMISSNDIQKWFPQSSDATCRCRWCCGHFKLWLTPRQQWEVHHSCEWHTGKAYWGELTVCSLTNFLSNGETPLFSSLLGGHVTLKARSRHRKRFSVISMVTFTASKWWFFVGKLSADPNVFWTSCVLWSLLTYLLTVDL